MATAQTLINRALRMIHVLDADESPTAAESSDCLDALNDMLDSWSIDRAYVYTVQEDSITWPADQQSRTVGPTGDIVISARPTKLENSTYYIDSGGDDYLLEILYSRRGYTSIVDKDTGSDLPQVLYFEPTHPDATLYIWPVPSAALTINLHSWAQLTSLAALTTTFAFPPGYKQAFMGSLAEEVAGEFGVAVPPEVSKMAYKARRRIKAINRPRRVAQLEVAALHEGRSYNIFTGD